MIWITFFYSEFNGSNFEKCSVGILNSFLCMMYPLVNKIHLCRYVCMYIVVKFFYFRWDNVGSNEKNKKKS